MAALTRNQKIAIGVGVGAAVLLVAGIAGASEPETGDECPPGFIRTPRPGFPGQWICTRAPETPPEPDLPPPPPPDDDLDPLPPKPPTCNYAGCGQQFDKNHQHPSYYAMRVQQLGYPINVVPIAANGSMIAVNPARSIIRTFQRDYNAARTAQTVSLPPPPAISEDGLVGNQTIAAIERAHTWVQILNMKWVDIVELA